MNYLSRISSCLSYLVLKWKKKKKEKEKEIEKEVEKEKEKEKKEKEKEKEKQMTFFSITFILRSIDIRRGSQAFCFSVSL